MLYNVSMGVSGRIVCLYVCVPLVLLPSTDSMIGGRRRWPVHNVLKVRVLRIIMCECEV